jgi:hypothetical protein
MASRGRDGSSPSTSTRPPATPYQCPWAVFGKDLGNPGVQATEASVQMPEPPCKPGPVPPEIRRRRTFLSDARCRAPLASRTRRLGRAARHPVLRRRRLPICSCTGWGLPCRPGYPGRGALLPHRFTLATHASRRRSAVCSLWHFPAGRPGRSLTGTLPCGARTFLGGHEFRRVRPDGSGKGDVTRRDGGGKPHRPAQCAMKPSGETAVSGKAERTCRSLVTRRVPSCLASATNSQS